MAQINIINVTVLDNPTAFVNPFQFEITFECLSELPDDLEWKVVYVGDAEDASHDQVLEEVMVGPVPVGINRFVLQANAPNPAMISNQDLIGVTVVLVTCSFMDNKFVQIGYYVNNEYSEPFEPENPPNPVEISKLYRNILSDQPRVTRFAIDWNGGSLPAAASDETSGDPAADQNEEEDVADMNEEDDDEDDEDGDEDEDEEVDLENLEEEDEAEDEGGSGSDNNYVSMDFHNEDSNSMDVERMLQHA